MEADEKLKKDYRVIWRLFYYASAFVSLFSDVAYTVSLRGNKATSDWLGRVDIALEKKSNELKTKKTLNPPKFFFLDYEHKTVSRYVAFLSS